MRNFILFSIINFAITSCNVNEEDLLNPDFTLIPSEKFLFKSFVDCNMAEAWIGDTFRIFPGKYGEDPEWGYSHELKFASGNNADEVFLTESKKFTEPSMPPNVSTGQLGLHGAVWFETIYQKPEDATGKTLYAIYHNENYPSTLPYNFNTGEGYIDSLWPQGITGVHSKAAVCRIGVMKSIDGGHSWQNKGLFIEDLQSRMILKPHNNSLSFAGGVGDPSAVASGEYLYLFYGEYGYPSIYQINNYDSVFEHNGQCISVARIKLSDLDDPQGKALRWSGNKFINPYNGNGRPILSLQIPKEEGGGATSRRRGQFHWGPSVSWNSYLNCWVMLMAKVEDYSWVGSSIYISFNKHKDLGKGTNSQDWTKPKIILDKPGHVIWYPSLQPMNTKEDIQEKRTCLKLGKKARLFFKDMVEGNAQYISEYIIEFEK
jgi:hypothetical protein